MSSHFYRCDDCADRKVYADVETFFADLATVFRQEIAGLAAAGCRYIQPDEVAVALLCDPAIRDQIKNSGSDPDALVDLYIDGINQAVAGCPADMAIGVHMCRGNFKGHYLAVGGYESVAERFFTNTKVTHLNTTLRAPATSRRCVSCPRIAAWCSASSAPRRRCWKAWTN